MNVCVENLLENLLNYADLGKLWEIAILRMRRGLASGQADHGLGPMCQSYMACPIGYD